MKYKKPRGTQDIIPPEVSTWRRVESAFESAFARFAYDEIRTPMFESTDLFVRAVGEQTDIISKEMYTFEDRGGRRITLRPENTASVVRAYLENGMHRLGGIQRLYYLGPMFRYDRPQAGRYRQFHQVGAEAIGSLNPAIDVELIQIVASVLAELGFDDVILKLNSVGCEKCRAPYRELLLTALDRVSDQLCADCRNRYRDNPLRVFDCKRCLNVKKGLPRISDHLDEECATHFERVREILGEVGQSYESDPELVRGLDYYTKTVFEVYYRTEGAQDALCGGGRYDNLVEQCGGKPTPAIGFSAGLERIIAALPSDSPVATRGAPAPAFYVASADDASSGQALRIAAALRRSGSAEVDLSGRSVKKMIQVAEKRHARVLVIVSAGDAIIWRNLGDRTERAVDESEVADLAAAVLTSQ